MDWILIVIILLCLASLVLNIIQVSRNNSENFANIRNSITLSDSNEMEAKDAEGAYKNAKLAAQTASVNAMVGKTYNNKEPFADVKNGSYLNFFDSEVPFQPGQSWMNLQQCYLNY